MGMFYSFYDHTGREWQSKEHGCTLRGWRIGDTVDSPEVRKTGVTEFEVYDFDEAIGELVFATATTEDGILTSITPWTKNELDA